MRREHRQAGKKGEKGSNSLVQAEGEEETCVLIHCRTTTSTEEELARKLEVKCWQLKN